MGCQYRLIHFEECTALWSEVGRAEDANNGCGITSQDIPEATPNNKTYLKESKI